jgi:hypothetical protein
VPNGPPGYMLWKHQGQLYLFYHNVIISEMGQAIRPNPKKAEGKEYKFQ